MSNEIIVENEETNREINEYDLQALYKSKVEPHLTEMKKVCKLNNLPFFFTIAVKNEKGKTKYLNDGVLTGSNNVGLYNDMFEKFLLVMHGAKIGYQEELDEDAINYIMEQLPGDASPQMVNSNDTNDSIIDFIGDL